MDEIYLQIHFSLIDDQRLNIWIILLYRRDISPLPTKTPLLKDRNLHLSIF